MSYRTKAFTLTALVGGASAAAALAAQRWLGAWAFSLALGVLAALAGARLLADWAEAPLRRLLQWMLAEDGSRLRIRTGDEWQDIARAISSERHSTRREIGSARDELGRLRAVLDTMADGVMVADADARVRLLNPAASSLLGLSPERALNRTVIECSMSAPLDTAVHQALSTGTLATAEMQIVYPSVRHVRALVSAAGEGPSRAAVVVLHDLTEAHRLEEVRRDFVANVSHELRTPVGGIRMMAENLLHGALEDPRAARGFLEHILQSSDRLVALVDDLLSLARAEVSTPPPRAPVALGPVARAVVAALDPAAAAKGLDVGVDVPDGLCVLADAESIRQILGNLLDNATKYTPAGGHVDVTARAEGGDVLVAISDTGIGIPADECTRIFERFYRVDRHRSREAGGTGLGLSIVRHLVDRLGGSVTVDSTPGQGSTFTVRLPGVGDGGSGGQPSADVRPAFSAP